MGNAVGNEVGGGGRGGVGGTGTSPICGSCGNAACCCRNSWINVVVCVPWLALLSAVTSVSLGLRLRGPGPEPKLSCTPGATTRTDWPELMPENPELCAAWSAPRPLP